MNTITLTIEKFDELIQHYLKTGIDLGRLGVAYNMDTSKFVDLVAKQHIHIFTKSNFTPPFRVGRKKKRVILDSKGIEYLSFKEGMEDEAASFCDYLNKSYL